jgi:lysophospholipase L1-like esterase
VSQSLHRDYAALNLQIQNRGISGNKVPDLDKRWQRDTIEIQPRVLSILIGVNDIWHKLAGRYDGKSEVYRDGLAALLQRTAKALPHTALVVCEPFVLMAGAVPDNQDKWFPEFDTRRQFARQVADNAGTVWVPFQSMFDQAVADGASPESLAADGVHPTAAGHQLMAQAWRQAVGL